MKLINYHIHTPFCRHATGTTEDYVQSAISQGLGEIGFSDHAPIPLPHRPGISMEPEETEVYINEVLALRDHYKDSIDIRLGFEVDFPLFNTFDKKYFTDPRIDYLMGSCHFLGEWAFDHPSQVDGYSTRDINDIYSDYYSIIDALVSSRLFNIVGHFDVVKKFGHRSSRDFQETITAIAAKLAYYGVAAEINTSGLLKPVKEMYPSDEIIDLFFEHNAPVTLGADVHSPDLVAYMLAEAVQKLKKAGYRKISGFRCRKRYDIML